MAWWERLRRFAPTDYDYPGTRFFLPSHHIRHDAHRRIEFIVIHITGGMNLGPVINHFVGSETRTRGASAHYIVDRNGDVIQMVRDADIACHCANIETPHNRFSIGIEHVCSPSAAITEAQYEASARLVNWLCQRHGMPMEHNVVRLAPGIRGHIEEYPSSTHRGCPNSVWDWERSIELVRGARS